jgi:hypothetical protein
VLALVELSQRYGDKSIQDILVPPVLSFLPALESEIHLCSNAVLFFYEAMYVSYIPHNFIYFLSCPSEKNVFHLWFSKVTKETTA